MFRSRLSDSAHLVADTRVGLITNQTGIDANGVDDVTRLLDADVNLTALFSPEHGFRGVLDQPEVGHGVDPATGLPIYSLYGAVRAPNAEMLHNIDVLVIDLQDIGSRTYTYVSTMILAMRAAQENGCAVVVLDRPNPIGAVLAQGPVLDLAHASFVGMLPVPLRHGMTMGELALMANDLLDINAGLTVVPTTGWVRGQWFDETGLPWVRPSPNMPSLESAAHYPGTVLFEATNLSVGRGTPIAFQVIAAPWLPAAEVVSMLPDLVGVSITDTTITPQDPTDRKYGGVELPALRFRVTDRATYDPTRLAVEVLRILRRETGDSLMIHAARMDRLAGTDRVRAVTDDVALDASWGGGLAVFADRVKQYLIYR